MDVFDIICYDDVHFHSIDAAKQAISIFNENIEYKGHKIIPVISKRDCVKNDYPHIFYVTEFSNMLNYLQDWKKSIDVIVENELYKKQKENKVVCNLPDIYHEM